MADVAIRVEKISKRYRRGLPAGNDRLSEAMSNLGKLALTLPGRLRRRASTPAERSAEFWALRNVSFEVKRGEVVGIVGRNGAGKTTLLKILSRITEPTGGRFGLAGRVGSLLEVGTGFHPELTGRENVYLNTSLFALSDRETDAIFRQIVEFAELEEFIDVPVKNYSSGMHARLGFAVAAHLDPDILLIDEVLAVGDARFQLKCFKRMAEFRRRGTTIVLVSHDFGLIEQKCDRACFVLRGRLEAEGSPPQVIERYRQTLVG